MKFIGIEMLQGKNRHRNSRRIFSCLVLAVLFSVSCMTPTAEGKPLALGDLLRLVEKEIQLARSKSEGRPKLIIDQMDIDITVIATSKKGMGVSFEVPVFGGAVADKSTEKRAQIFSFSFKPSGSMEISKKKRSLGLADAILKIQKEIKSALREKTKFKLKEFKLTIDFAMAREQNGNFKFLVFDVEAGVNDIHQHKIILTMHAKR